MQTDRFRGYIMTVSAPGGFNRYYETEGITLERDPCLSSQSPLLYPYNSLELDGAVYKERDES